MNNSGIIELRLSNKIPKFLRITNSYPDRARVNISGDYLTVKTYVSFKYLRPNFKENEFKFVGIKDFILHGKGKFINLAFEADGRKIFV